MYSFWVKTHNFIVRRKLCNNEISWNRTSSNKKKYVCLFSEKQIKASNDLDFPMECV